MPSPAGARLRIRPPRSCYTCPVFHGTDLRNERKAGLYGGRDGGAHRRLRAGLDGQAGRGRAGDRGSAPRHRAILRRPERGDPRAVHGSGERTEPRQARAREGAASGAGHRGYAGHRQARPAVAQRGLPAHAPRQRRALRRRRSARGERSHRRHHGAGGPAGARGRSRGARRRRWRRPKRAERGSATPTARRRSGRPWWPTPTASPATSLR